MLVIVAMDLFECFVNFVVLNFNYEIRKIRDRVYFKTAYPRKSHAYPFSR